MDTIAVTEIMREAVNVALKLGAPILLLSMAVGVIVALFQAVTQIHEQTIGFLLKLVVVVAMLIFGGGWMLKTLQEYLRSVFQMFTL